MKPSISSADNVLPFVENVNGSITLEQAYIAVVTMSCKNKPEAERFLSLLQIISAALRGVQRQSEHPGTLESRKCANHIIDWIKGNKDPNLEPIRRHCQPRPQIRPELDKFYGKQISKKELKKRAREEKIRILEEELANLRNEK